MHSSMKVITDDARPFESHPQPSAKNIVQKPYPGWGHFRPQGHNLNKLGRGPLDDATYHRPCDSRQEDF